MSDLTRLSAAKLEALLAKRSERVDAASHALIVSGHGMERVNETRQRATETGEALACEFVAASDDYFAAVEEMSARKRWHGSLKPISRGKGF